MQHDQPRGVILLFIVLIMGSTSLAAAAMLTRGSLSGLLDANEQVTSLTIRAKVMGCLDEAFIQLQKNASWAPATVSTGMATCTMTVSTPVAGQQRVHMSLTESGITRVVRADVIPSPFAVVQIIDGQ